MSLRSLRRTVGQVLLAGFDGPTIPPGLRSLAREFSLAGIVIFKRNVQEPAQVAELAYHARTLLPATPLWVGVDQEGGRVARLRSPFTEWPPMAALGRAEPGEAEDLARRFAAALAAELKAVGITLDFAPVLDVLTNAANPVIGDRALSDDPTRVAALGRIVIEELQRVHVAACGKHFPGHGDTSVDSHHDLPLVEHPPERLRAVEFEPFRAAIDADVAGIMTAHVHVPCFEEHGPATLSRAIVTGLLRDELHFDGIVFTDDLDMKAVAARYSMGEIAVQALAAGCDGLLSCGTNVDRHVEALEAVIHAVEEERLPLSRVEEAIARHQRAKERFLTPEAPRPHDARALRDLVGRLEHQAVALDLRRFA
jgi:beta-N-acetylhexosaminidase